MVLSVEACHGEKAGKRNVFYRAGWIVNIIVCYDDLFPWLVKCIKKSEFSVIGTVFGDRICNLYQVFLPAIDCKKIYFLGPFGKNGDVITHINEFIENDVLKVVSKVKSSLCTENYWRSQAKFSVLMKTICKYEQNFQRAKIKCVSERRFQWHMRH